MQREQDTGSFVMIDPSLVPREHCFGSRPTWEALRLSSYVLALLAISRALTAYSRRVEPHFCKMLHHY
jgi:hypothetical protein